MLKKIIISLIILVIVVATVVYFFVEPIIEKQARKIIKENVPIKIEFNSVHIGFIPPSIKVNDIKIYNKEKAEINIDRIKIFPEILPLFSKKIVISSIKVNKPVIIAYCSENSTNIQDIISQLTNRDKTETKKKAESEINIEVGNIYVRKAKILFYQNKEDSAALLDVSPVNIDIGRIKTGNKNLETSFNAAAGLFGNKPNILLKGAIKPFAEITSGKGNINIENFNITDIKKFIKDSMDIQSGIIDIKVPFTLNEDKIYIGDAKLNVRDIKIALIKSEQTDKKDTGQISVKGPEIPGELNINSIMCKLKNIDIGLDNKKQNLSVFIKQGNINTGKIAYNVSNSDINSNLVLSKPDVTMDLKGKLNIIKGILSSNINFTMNNLNMVSLNPFIEDIFSAEIKSGKMELTADGLISWNKLNLKCKSVSENVKLKNKRDKTKNKFIFGVPVSILIKYLTETEGKLILEFNIGGTIPEPEANVSKVMRKIIGAVITDFAITNAIGLPAVIGDKIIEKTTGKSIIKSTKKQIKGLLKKK